MITWVGFKNHSLNFRIMKVWPIAKMPMNNF